MAKTLRKAEPRSEETEIDSLPVPDKPSGMITLPVLSTKLLTIRLVGDTPLIMHRWSVKAKEMILNKQKKKAIQKKEARNPEADYKESLYMMSAESDMELATKDDLSPFHVDEIMGEKFVPCFPAIAFKAAAVSACTSVAGITKVSARQCFHIDREFIPIEGRHKLREDMVRIGMGTADLRYRAEFQKWAATLPVVYNTNVLSAEQLINLFQTAGFAVGIGEYRPERDGPYGRFHVEV